MSATLSISPLLAQQPSTDITAQALFDAGMKLKDAGKFADACPKLADSARIDPGVGTLLQLADCYEKNGQTASAWVTWQNAEVAARDARPPQPKLMNLARDHAAALAPNLSHVKITATTAVGGMVIKRDGALVSSSEWGLEIPADPGKHTLDVSAPDRSPWSSDFDVPAKGTVIVVIPTLAMAPVVAPPSPTSAGTTAPMSVPPSGGDTLAVQPGRSSQKTWAIVSGGVGVVGLVVGTIFVVDAKSKYDNSVGDCRPTDANLCSPTGVSLRDDARKSGWIATAGYGVGALGLAGAAVLWFTAPSSSISSPTKSARWMVAPTLGGAVVRGIW